MKEKIPVFVFAAVLLLLTLLLPALSVPTAAERGFVVIIDPGHGGDDGASAALPGLECLEEEEEQIQGGKGREASNTNPSPPTSSEPYAVVIVFRCMEVRERGKRE